MEGETIVSKTKWIAVIRPHVDSDGCVLCGTCTEFCPDGCITISDEEGCAVVDYDSCLGCSMCAAVCPEGAIEMVIDEVEP